MASARDHSLDTFLDLHGQTVGVDEAGHGVQCVVQRTAVTSDRPHGLRYSLTRPAPDGTSLVGFANAHPIPARQRSRQRQRGESDHQHRFRTVRPSPYTDAVTLLAAFWDAVDRVLKARGVLP